MRERHTVEGRCGTGRARDMSREVMVQWTEGVLPVGAWFGLLHNITPKGEFFHCQNSSIVTFCNLSNEPIVQPKNRASFFGVTIAITFWRSIAVVILPNKTCCSGWGQVENLCDMCAITERGRLHAMRRNGGPKLATDKELERKNVQKMDNGLKKRSDCT